MTFFILSFLGFSMACSSYLAGDAWVEKKYLRLGFWYLVTIGLALGFVEKAGL